MLSVPADGGLPAFRHLIDAAASKQLQILEPNAGLGSRAKIERFAQQCGLTRDEWADIGRS